MRPEVAWFAEQMEKKLLANDHKGGWDKMSYEELKSRLIEETGELIGALYSKDPKRIIDEATDVANFCMFISDVAKKTEGEGNEANQEES